MQHVPLVLSGVCSFLTETCCTSVAKREAPHVGFQRYVIAVAGNTDAGDHDEL